MITRSRLRRSSRLRQKASQSAPTLFSKALEQIEAAARRKARRHKTARRRKHGTTSQTTHKKAGHRPTKCIKKLDSKEKPTSRRTRSATCSTSVKGDTISVTRGTCGTAVKRVSGSSTVKGDTRSATRGMCGTAVKRVSGSSTVKRDTSSERRSQSPRSRKKTRKQEIAEGLRQRIQAIPSKGRSVPKSNNIRQLALELKIRLASKCLPFHVTGRRGVRCNVTQIAQRERTVPIWGISKEQDPILLSKEQVIVDSWKTLVRKWG